MLVIFLLLQFQSLHTHARTYFICTSSYFFLPHLLIWPLKSSYLVMQLYNHHISLSLSLSYTYTHTISLTCLTHAYTHSLSVSHTRTHDLSLICCQCHWRALNLPEDPMPAKQSRHKIVLQFHSKNVDLSDWEQFSGCKKKFGRWRIFTFLGLGRKKYRDQDFVLIWNGGKFEILDLKKCSISSIFWVQS